MKKYKKITIITIIVILILAVVFVATGLFSRLIGSKSYNVVYLTTGQIYVGKLASTMSDRMIMTDSYLLKTLKDTEDETKVNFQLSSLKDNLWFAEKLYINEDQIIFYGPVGIDSQIGKALLK